MSNHIDLAGAKILVVGASGFLGRPLVRRLVTLDAQVTAVSRNPRAEADGAQWIASDASDASDAEQMSRLFEQTHPDLVYILTSDSRGGPDLEFVQASVRNDGLLGGYARMFMRLYGTPISILRVMMTYGAGQKSYKLIPCIIQSLLQNQTAKLSSGKRLVDLVYVDDVVDAFVRTAARTPLNETIDIGSGKLVSIRDCALQIGSFMGRSHLLQFDPGRDRAYEEVKAANTRPAAERLGWQATTPLSDGLKRTIAAFESQLGPSR